MQDFSTAPVLPVFPVTPAQKNAGIKKDTREQGRGVRRSWQDGSLDVICVARSRQTRERTPQFTRRK